MRFDVTKEYKVSDLLLDEGNYRFKEAKNQKECVAKIYFANPPYFKGLMESIAEDDLGEPLLVFSDKKKNIVLDGNRRLAALKVLSSDDFLPADNLQEYVNKIRENAKVDFSRIQAQVSSDKKIVMKTVYERHAGGKTGKARIPWNAYAAARFGFFEEIGDNNEWHFVALLTKTEDAQPKISEYIDGNKFSYETFRRLMREAFKRKLISQEIFSGRNKHIKSTADKKLVNDAVAKTLKILEAMEGREISLSRGETFADQKTVEKFFDSFTLSPDAQRVEDAKNAANQNEGDKEGGNAQNSDRSQAQDDEKSNNTGHSQSSAENPADQNDDGEDTGNGRQPNNGIKKSDEIEKELKKLASTKLSRLYYSLCTVSLNTHPELMYGGAWMFFEILAKLAGNIDEKTGKRKDEFAGFFNNRMQSLGISKEVGKECFKALSEIRDYGNATKHSTNQTRMTAIQLRNDFEVLEPLIIAAIKQAAAQKTKKAA